MEPLSPALTGQLATTLPLVGLIRFVQIVAYPMFATVARAEFPAYHAAHSRRITWIVAPLMAGELIFAGLWLLEQTESALRPLAWSGAALALGTWVATAFLSVPQHQVLARGFDPRAHRLLVATNWIRVALWTSRGAMLLWVVARGIG